MDHKKTKVVVLGPILPFRGGIAQHTTMLARHLRAISATTTISYSRQYPKFLYPGESDKDPGYLGHIEPATSYFLDSVNPLSWIRTAKKIVALRPCVVIMPWWTIFWAPCYLVILSILAFFKVQTLIICHNIVDHEFAVWKRLLTRQTLRLGGVFLTHTQMDATKLTRLLPNARILTLPHPVYSQFPMVTRSLPRRAKLELLFFGFVRPYKGLEVLLEAMERLSDFDVYLSVVGEWWRDEKNIKERLTNGSASHRIELVDFYVTDEQVATFFDRADAIVLPYLSATGTGVIPISYHYKKPVIASAVGGIPDVVLPGLSGILVAETTAVAFEKAIRAFSKIPRDHWRRGVERISKTLTWGNFSENILSFVKLSSVQKEKNAH